MLEIFPWPYCLLSLQRLNQWNPSPPPPPPSSLSSKHGFRDSSLLWPYNPSLTTWCVWVKGHVITSPPVCSAFMVYTERQGLMRWWRKMAIAISGQRHSYVEGKTAATFCVWYKRHGSDSISERGRKNSLLFLLTELLKLYRLHSSKQQNQKSTAQI